MNKIDEILQNKAELTPQLINTLISFIDLTSLGSNDSTETVDRLVKKATQGFSGTTPAAVCVFPEYGPFVKQNLPTQIKTAVVGGNFPTGRTFTQAKLKEIECICQTGVDEIDIVLNHGHFFDQNYTAIINEISAIKQVMGSKHLKVILETGILGSEENIRIASELAIEAGADFIKTSTGKTTIGASPEAVATMCETIKNHAKKTGKKIGIKPSGGIRTPEDAITYYSIIKAILGEEWLTPTLFRLGASSLFDNLIKHAEQTNG